MRKIKEFKKGDKVKFPVYNGGDIIKGAFFHGIFDKYSDNKEAVILFNNKPMIVDIENLKKDDYGNKLHE